MNDNEPGNGVPGDLPEIAVQKRQGLSIVWLIPLVAALIGGWLAYRTISEKGPTIAISFQTAAGLDAGKTQVKYKSVQVGLVDTIRFSEDLSHVIVTATLDKDMEEHLGASTRFWVVRPRIGAGGVSGLETLVSGAYIAIEPGEGAAAKKFKGLEIPPLVTADSPGIDLILEADKLGSLSAGSPIYFRDIKVGEVLGYELTENRELLLVHVFVKAPFNEFVREGSRFWSVSGLEVSVGDAGLQVKMESLEALVTGGIAFDTPDLASPPAKEDARFTLYENFASIGEASYTQKLSYVAYFEGSVRGLKPGAAVEFRGIKVGSVSDIRVELTNNEDAIQIGVFMEIEPQRIRGRDTDKSEQEVRQTLTELFRRGLRAQLETGSLLTGQLFVDLDFYPNMPLTLVGTNTKVPEFPTLPSTLERLKSTTEQLVADLRNLPLDAIAKNVLGTLEGVNKLVNSPEISVALREVNKTLSAVQALLKGVDGQVTPVAASIQKAAGQASRALAKADEVMSTMSQGSPTRNDLNDALKEAASAARSLRLLADYLERHPDALIYGKGAGRR